MKVKTIKSLCGMLALLAFTACSSNIDESADAPHFYNVTLTASMGDETTRALSESGNVITATFAENDEVKVVKADGSLVGTLKALSAGESTTLSGTLDAASLTVGEKVTLRYRSATANYDGQLGTLAGIAANQDYAEGTLTVSTTSPSLTFESNSVTLSAMQSITKFTFKDVSTNAAVSVKTFGIAAVGLVQSIAANGSETIGAVTGTLAPPYNSVVYVALRNNIKPEQKLAYSFTIQDENGNWYIFTKQAKLTNGKNYALNIALTPLLALHSGDAVGSIGVLDGLPAIVLNSTTAVALMNAGALCPEAYGTYNIFENLPSLTGSWRVPTQAELVTLAGFSSSWIDPAPYGVNGRTFTIGGSTLFLPAAGYIDNDVEVGEEPVRLGKELVSTFGYYWSQSEATPSSMAYSLQFSSANINVFSEYEVNALPVRPFHALN